MVDGRDGFVSRGGSRGARGNRGRGRGGRGGNFNNKERTDPATNEEFGGENAGSTVHSYYSRTFGHSLKKYYFDLYNFEEGKVLKISEVFGVHQRISIHLPIEAIGELKEKLGKFNEYNSGLKVNDLYEESIVFKGQRFALVLGFNIRGTIVTISQISKMVGAQAQIKINPLALTGFINELHEISAQLEPEDYTNLDDYPPSSVVHCVDEKKTFFFDPIIREDEKCLRISQVKLKNSSTLMNINIHIPVDDLKAFRDAFIAVCEKLE